MKRYEHINTMGSTFVECELKESVWGKLCIDMSLYQPESELVKQIEKRRNLTGDEIQAFYDFANGRDTGKRIPLHRQAKNKDIADLAIGIRENQKEIKEKIDLATEIASYEQSSATTEE